MVVGARAFSRASQDQSLAGRLVHIYAHRRTHQVLYSLSATLEKRHLKQLPYLGKKTVPAELRKDLWSSFATIHFPTKEQCLDGMQKLREFRKRHELEWDLEPIRTLEKSKRARLLQDQRANTVADMAAVMQLQEVVANEHAQLAELQTSNRGRALERSEQREAELQKLKADARTAYMAIHKSATPASTEQPENIEAARDNYKKYNKELMRLKSQLKVLRSDASDASPGGDNNASSLIIVPESFPEERHRRAPKFTMAGMRIAWAEITDAEYAATWPKTVLHEKLKEGLTKQRHVTSPIRTHHAADASSMQDTRQVRRHMSPGRAHQTPANLDTPSTMSSRPQRTIMQAVVDRLRFGSQPTAQAQM